MRLPLYCRGCARFVSSPLAVCRSCGHMHTRDAPAGEDPPVLRRPAYRGGRYKRKAYRR